MIDPQLAGRLSEWRRHLHANPELPPVTETTNLPYASANLGVMHACGHDGHTASLLGAAALLARDADWRAGMQNDTDPQMASSRTIQFITPAKAGAHRARALIAAWVPAFAGMTKEGALEPVAGTSCATLSP